MIKIVEFVGLTGSGKTTVSRELIKKLRKSGTKCISYRDIKKVCSIVDNRVLNLLFLLFHCGYFYIFRTGYIIKIYRYVISIKPYNRDSFMFGLSLLWLYFNVERCIDKLELNNYEYMICEQSFLQSMWSTALNGELIDDRRLDDLITYIYRKHNFVIVYIDIDVDTAVCRIKNRETNTSRFDNVSQEIASRWLTQHKEYLEKIYNITKSKININVIELDGKIIANQNVNEIYEYLKKITINRD